MSSRPRGPNSFPRPREPSDSNRGDGHSLHDRPRHDRQKSPRSFAPPPYRPEGNRRQSRDFYRFRPRGASSPFRGRGDGRDRAGVSQYNPGTDQQGRIGGPLAATLEDEQDHDVLDDDDEGGNDGEVDEVDEDSEDSEDDEDDEVEDEDYGRLLFDFKGQDWDENQIREKLPQIDEDDVGDNALSLPEVQYLYSREQKLIGKPVAYEPSGFPLDQLQGLRPEFARDKEGLQETVEAKMRLMAGKRAGEYTHEGDIAKRFIRGETVMFDDDEEKNRVLEWASSYLERLETVDHDGDEVAGRGGGDDNKGMSASFSEADGGGLGDLDLDSLDDDDDDDSHEDDVDFERDEDIVHLSRELGPLVFEPASSQPKKILLETLVRGSYPNVIPNIATTTTIGPDPRTSDKSVDGRRIRNQNIRADGGAGAGTAAVKTVLDTFRAGNISRDQTGILQHIGRATSINETYSPGQQSIFLDKVQAIWKAENSDRRQ